jgi:hypothetical protein
MRQPVGTEGWLDNLHRPSCRTLLTMSIAAEPVRMRTAAARPGRSYGGKLSLCTCLYRYGAEAGPTDPRGLGRRLPGKAARVRRNRWYFVMMGACLALVIAAWTVVRVYSVTAAIVMSVVAAVIPPIAVIFVNAGDEPSRRL